MGIWPVGKGSKLNQILVVRWSGQVTDGLFQSALASFVLFSPERSPNAVSAALAFAVVLLPYSLIGPYVGTFLDRFSRQRIIRNCNYLRAADLLIIAWLINNGSTGVVLTLFVLFAFGINRLILAGLSAGLPLLVKKEELIAANALAAINSSFLTNNGNPAERPAKINRLIPNANKTNKVKTTPVEPLLINQAMIKRSAARR